MSRPCSAVRRICTTPVMQPTGKRSGRLKQASIGTTSISLKEGTDGLMRDAVDDGRDAGRELLRGTKECPNG
ncbi:hypothetical protein GCM10009549_53130 [Streptomyces thermoalcalitolerans]|uniref:Uncharacterized protein n=1 Tax=Streptomyces thermoalcalitolerans TaxID=65605 RepID=A0ABN1PLG8_9ACTN